MRSGKIQAWKSLSYLKADLVVALASATMGDKVTALLLSDTHLGTSDDRASQGGTEQIPPLVDGVALNSAEAQFVDELLLEVLNDPAILISAFVCITKLTSSGPRIAHSKHVHLCSTNLDGLSPDSLPVLLLTDIGKEADDLIALLCLQCQQLVRS